MRRVAFLAAVTLALALPVPARAGEEKTFGQGVGKAQQVELSELIAHPETYVGKAVRVEGIVVDVCAKRGCWMDIAADGGSKPIRIKVEDGVMVFPLEAKGRRAVAEGVFTKIEMSPEEAKALAAHEAEERDREPGSADAGNVETVVYQIAGTGAVIK
jgi:hypothetical protein